jgi:F0F1-type ATP synthase membrane subunit b/b'
MTKAATNAREALVAELLGDVQTLLDRFEQVGTQLAKADANAQATAAALNAATAQYRAQVDEMVARLRAETSSIITHTTQHAAETLVNQQSAMLQQAAINAMQHAFATELGKRTRREWIAALLFTVVVSMIATATVLLLRA